MISSKQVKEIDSFDKETGMCILVTHGGGKIRVGIKQCDEGLVKQILKDESEKSSKKWWQFWKS